MKRIVFICAAFLVMFLIIGASIHAINDINRINKKTREESEAKEFAATIAAATENTTTIWDYIRDNSEAEMTTPTDAGQMTTDPAEGAGDSAAETVPADPTPNENSEADVVVVN